MVVKTSVFSGQIVGVVHPCAGHGGLHHHETLLSTQIYDMREGGERQLCLRCMFLMYVYVRAK